MDLNQGHKRLIEKHVRALDWMRDELMEMDSLINPVMGISSWDDAVIVDYKGKKLVVSVDGPYTKRLVMKSALIHSATDVMVKGAKPLFALDTVIGGLDDVKEMMASLKRQALAMNIPLLGGNTLFEEAEPRCSLTVVGRLLSAEPIRDSGAKKGDILALLGEPLWGVQEERIIKANKLFDTWFTILDKDIKINASKDVTKGGLISAVYEISEKSSAKFVLEEKPPFSVTRNLDNFLLSVPEKSFQEIRDICKKTGCSFVAVGKILR